MFSLKNNKHSHNLCVSVSEHMLSAVSYNSKENTVENDSMTPSRNSMASNFVSMIKKLNLNGKRCAITLLPEQYDVVTLDKLAVKDDELQEAIKWHVHDKVNRAVDDILVEYIEIPKAIDNSKNNKLIAFVTSKKLVYELLEYSNKAGLIADSVSISDISIMNLLEIFSEKNNHNTDIIIFYYAHPTGGKIVVYHDGHILLIRNIVVHYTKDNFHLLMDEYNRSIEFCRTTLKIERPVVKLISDKYLKSLDLEQDHLANLDMTTLDINDLAGNKIAYDVQDEHILLLNFGIICQGMEKYVPV